MPSRSNPNVPSKYKRKTASVLKNKRKHIKRLAASDNVAMVSKRTAPRTSQAIRQSAPLSRKKARKLEKKEAYTRQRKELEKYLEADFEMRDVEGKNTRRDRRADGVGKESEKMEID
ncbi:MAG: hypothetical protein Q9219_000381 [cf. Caloplaca sp. 3 TL-2023]